VGAHLRPVGPLPEAVYWRRRAALLLGVLLLLVLLRACTGGEEQQEEQLQSAPAQSSAPAPAAPAPAGTPAPSSSPAASQVSACPDDALELEVRTGTLQYRVGGQLPIRMTVRNVGDVPCTRPLGQGSVELRVLSGSDQIWSSDDCSPGGPAGRTRLKPGQAEAVQLAWSGRRSRPGCRGPGEQALPGTYRAIGRVGELTRSSELFTVLPGR